MKLIDHARVIFVLESEPGSAGELCAQLEQQQAAVVLIHLHREREWRRNMQDGLIGLQYPGQGAEILVLAPQPFNDASFWRTQDGLVEALENRPTPVAVLSHGDGRQLAIDGEDRQLVLSDGVPSEPTAVLFDSRVFGRLIDLMPDCGIQGALSPTDWLTIALWLSRAVSGGTCCSMAWPAFAQSSALDCSV